MKGFEFERALMEEHFNENYVESSKYPKSEFRGVIMDNSLVNYSKDGIYPVKVKGKITIHGVTGEVESAGKITIKSGKIYANAGFSISLADYGILVPALVSDKVAKTATITVDCSLEPLK
jgi:polyisoprenoid-binding protein YceI